MDENVSKRKKMVRLALAEGDHLKEQYKKRLEFFSQKEHIQCFTQIRRGIEKESLRVSPQGRISQTSHPKALGSALTNGYITTDYSEALLEFITPAYAESTKPLEVMENIHKFVYRSLEHDELLWSASMPCAMKDESLITIAQYGSSNSAKMKEIYRRGLGHRYGRYMQTISGVHYNFSLSDDFWKFLSQFERFSTSEENPLRNFISSEYMGLIRNFLRTSWIIPYLFGASPAICESYLRGKKSHLDQLVPGTVYGPYATSLRLSDLGYSNNAQGSLNITYNCVEGYIKGLEEAIRTPEPLYEKIGVKVDGEYRQLNANLLQIENEYYSNIRPKRVTQSGERPTKALHQRGIEYIEVRALDLNLFDPNGLSPLQSDFVDCLLIHNLFTESPIITTREESEIQENKRRIVEFGRHPTIRLIKDNREISMRRLANQLFDELVPIAKMLDESYQTEHYEASITQLHKWIEQPEITFSGRIVDEIKQRGDGFFALGMDYSKQHAEYFKNSTLSEEQLVCFKNEAEKSLQLQAEMESDNRQSFEDFLASYFA